jgi:Calx-beta domain-containing protein
MRGKVRLVRLSVTAAVTLSVLPVFDVRAGAGCGDINSAMALGPFHAGTTPPLFYGTEGGGGAFNVRWTGFSCGQLIQVTAEYSDVPGSATEPADYSLPQGRTPPVCEVGCDPGGNRQEETIAFALANDPEVETVTETFTVVLSNALGGVIDAPLSAPFVIVDDEAPTRVSFDDLAASQSETYEALSIPVWLAGPAVGATIPFTAGSGPSSGATSGTDFTVATPSPLVFAPAERLKFITLLVVNDQLKEADETVQIDLQGGVSPSTKIVTIVDNEEGTAPSSKLHHPRHRWRYPYNDYRLREIHVFTKDEQGGSGVVKVELALRRRMKDGRCGWWNGKRFRRGDCSEQRWLPTKPYEPGFFYYYRIKALGPSVGTHTMNYTAYARATDGAGNVEDVLQIRRNRNTFEVKQKSRLT